MFCIPVNPQGGKVARVNAISPAIESGHVFIPDGEQWAEDFIDQWTAFPAGAHDDMVDCGSQALSYMLHLTGDVPVPQTLEEIKRARRADSASEAFLNDAALFDVYGTNNGVLY
jgi:hypothetical protein